MDNNRSNLNLLYSRLAGAAILILIFYAYYPILQADFVNYDDGLYITNNTNIQDGISVKSIFWAFQSFYAANWHPLTMLSHMLDFHLYGMNASGHHLTNVILHIGNSLLLLLVLQLMTGELWRSTLVAFLFALHPLHVESVAWISERKDVLSTFFMLLSLLAYHKYCSKNKKIYYALVTFFYLLGLLAKPTAIPVLA